MRKAHFRAITIFSNNKRRQELEAFRNLVTEYFSDFRVSWPDVVIEGDDARRIRPLINAKLKVSRAYVRAAGVYEADKQAAKIRTFNPFWWIGRALTAVIHLPFIALNAAGFDANAIENSIFGKVLKLIFWAAAGLVALIQLWELGKG